MAAPPARPVVRTYRDAKRVTRVLCWLLVVLAVLAGLAAIAELAHYRVLRAMIEQDSKALASFSPMTELMLGLRGLIKLGHATALSGTIVAFAMWVYRMQANTFALGMFGLRFTPAWAVGWYFVPVANFWMPCRAMSETWRANRNPAGWQFDPVPGFLILWWLLWLSSTFYFRISVDSASLQDALAARKSDAGVDCARGALGSISAVISLNLVARLDRFQERAASQLLTRVFE